jgi:hypothetical protein
MPSCGRVLVLAAAVALLCSTSGLGQQYSASFSGEVRAGQAFRKKIGGGLVFVLNPMGEDGWRIEVQPEAPCDDGADFTAPVTFPAHGCTAADLGPCGRVSAGEAVAHSPRVLLFDTNCRDYKRDSEELEWLVYPYTHKQNDHDPYEDRPPTKLGKLVLVIVDSKVSALRQWGHAGTADKIDWLKFTVRIEPPGVRDGLTP